MLCSWGSPGVSSRPTAGPCAWGGFTERLSQPFLLPSGGFPSRLPHVKGSLHQFLGLFQRTLFLYSCRFSAPLGGGEFRILPITVYWTGISNSTLDKTRSIMGPTGWLLLNYRRKKASVRQEVLLPRSYRENTEGSTETREVISVASLGRAVQGLSPMNMVWIRGRKGRSLTELQPRLDCTKSLRVWFGTC